jgi:hypothetical protein
MSMSVDEPEEKMSVGVRDEKMNEIASIAAERFCEMHTPVSRAAIRNDPEKFLDRTIPYLTVRALHLQRDILQRHEAALARHEAALKSLEADSRWIRRLTWALLGLTAVLAYFALRLDTVIHSLQSNASPSPTATATPTPN